MIEWFERLPDQCPPSEAFNPEGYSFYRFSKTESPTENDFVSKRYSNPGLIFNGVSECIARSLSVYDDFDKCLNMIKLPRHKNKWKSILELNLKEGDGLVLKTFNDPHHFSWWRSISFTFESVKKVR